MYLSNLSDVTETNSIVDLMNCVDVSKLITFNFKEQLLRYQPGQEMKNSRRLLSERESARMSLHESNLKTRS